MNVMHEGQWEVDTRTVSRLVEHQFPEWRQLPVAAVRSNGTVNALFRLGDDVVLRFPLLPSAAPQRREQFVSAQANLTMLAERVALRVPRPLAIGEPDVGYPGYWAAYEWIPGASATSSLIGDLHLFAKELAEFIVALHEVPTDGRSWSGVGRGGPLRQRDQQVRQCIAQSAALIDATRVESAWDECVAVGRDTHDTWIHGDLMAENLLALNGRLIGVIDCDEMSVGDLAVDLMPAWNFLTSGPRETFRRALAPSDSTWMRGRGWSLCQAVVALPYYVETNRVMAETAQRTLAALLE